MGFPNFFDENVGVRSRGWHPIPLATIDLPFEEAVAMLDRSFFYVGLSPFDEAF